MLMRRVLCLICVASLSCVSFGADYTLRPKQDIVEAKVPLRSEGVLLSVEDVNAAILSACDRRGWTAEATSQNSIHASLKNRDYLVEVNITFSPTNYSITYLSSRYIKYEPTHNRTHSKYHSWLETLSKDIQNQLFLSLLAK